MNEINEKRVISILESYLFTFSGPVCIDEIHNFFNTNDIPVNRIYIKKIINTLREKYNSLDSGLELITLEEKIQLVTKKENFTYIEKAISKTKKKNLTSSAIETLTIIAYNQPTTKSTVEKIKGVKSDTTINKLLEIGLIEECGKLDKIGKPTLYKTTELFLKHVGISSIEALPKIENKGNDLGEKYDENK